MVPVWIEEMKKWLAGKHVRHPITDKLTVSIGRYSKTDDLPDITVMSYESLRLAAKELANPERIGGKSWDYVILDESHRVKDEHSVQACVIMGGRPKRRKTENPLVPDLKTPGNDNIEYPGIPSKRRLLLTGTPIPSYAWELYANLHFIRPDIFNDEDEFMYQFADMKAFNSTIWKKNRVSGAPELHRLFITKPVKPKNMTLMNKILFGGGTYNSKGGKKHFKGLVMRRVHKDLETLGDKYTWPPRGKPKYLAITEPQDQKGLDAKTEELSQMEQRIQAAIQRNASPDELAELEHEYNEKVKVSFQRVAKVRNAIGMKKAPYVANEAVIQASGEQEGKPNQVLVFAYHKNVIETIATSIQAQFEKQGHPEWKVAVVYGATSDKKREETFKQFQTDPNVKVIVASYKVLKEGITLTAANKVIHAELMPNPIDYEQSYARAWRRGQQRTVDETYMWLPRSFDQRLYNIASGKFAAANRILNYRLPEEQETKPETN
jgi:SNF2 family DNA or RNA helicase